MLRNAALDSPNVGVEPLADLAPWFATSVAPAVLRAALEPDEGMGVLSHVTSHMLSAFTFRRQGLVSGDDVLRARAEYYLDQKDLDSAARESNLLRDGCDGPAEGLARCSEVAAGGALSVRVGHTHPLLVTCQVGSFDVIH